jgi:predicted nuclease of predicted toxin-antitoxin system
LFETGVGKKAEQAVTELGFDVKTLRYANAKLTDQEILEIAAEQDRIVVTLDKDFGELVFRSHERNAGVLLLRMDDASGEAKAKALRDILLSHAEELTGRFSVYQNGILRIR